jgi:DNA mismatch repair protein MutL
MSDIIQLLPDSVANQIAAGEVIQRPASVVKELVENAVDAGATEISVLTVDAGRTMIQVIDNGKGMSGTDARLAFERHATSKIRKADDLFSLHTMGFRGEALPSIAAVSQVEVRTRMEGEELGTCLNISASKVQNQTFCSCPVGCNLKVSNIFYNVPARRKFLKSNTTEMNNMLKAFERIALVYPEIEFRFQSNGGEVFNLKKGNTHQRIVDIFGKKFGQSLLPVNVNTSICKVSGFVGRPESSKKKCMQQFFFVNGRYMKHPYFAKAVESVFERMVPQGEQVPFFMYLEVDPADIDVNIHPTKTEIKFENENSIWQILSAAVREAVGVFNEVPTIDFDVNSKPDIPVFEKNGDVMLPKANYNPAYNPFQTGKTTGNKSTESWEELYQAANIQSRINSDIFDVDSDKAEKENPLADKSSVHFQYKGQYIVTSIRSGLMIIDQHRAHIRVLYEEYISCLKGKKTVSQRMLFPEAVQLNACDIALLDMIIEEMTLLGFELTPLGSFNYAINSVPSGLEGINPSSLVNDMIADAVQSGTTVKDEINHTLSLSMARKAAIPYGQLLSNEEMDDLIERLFKCENVNHTPDGKKVYTLLSENEIEHIFG